MRKILSLFLAAAMLFTMISTVPAFASGGLEVIIDHDNPTASIDIPEYTYGGAWTTSSVTGAGHAGTNGSQATVVVNSWAMWKPAAGALSDGTYEVWVFNVRRASAWDENVQFEVVNNVQGVNLNNKYFINQKTVNNATDSSWVKLCTTQFSGNGNEYVKLTRVSEVSGIYTQADRVKFVPVTSLSTNANLGSMSLYANLGGSSVQLFPDQHIVGSTTDYTVRIPKLINGQAPQNLTLSVASESPSASVSINLGSAATACNSIDFTTVFGENKHRIDITSQEQSISKTYNITILQEGDMIIVDDKLNIDKFAKFGDGWTESTANSVYDPPEVKALDTGATKDHHWWTTSANAYATFTPDLSASGAGTYEAYIWGSVHTADPVANRLPSADVETTHSSMVEKSVVAMDNVPIKWMYIGKYHFTADGTEFIKVSRTSGYTQQFRVSTIKLIKVANDTSSNKLSALNLKLSPLKIVNATDFTSNTYSIDLPKTATNITFSISPVNSQAEIKVNGESVTAFTNITKQVFSGLNTFTVAITAGSGTSTYTLNVNKLGEQVNIAPDSTGVADGYLEGGTGWSKSGLAIGVGGGSNTRYTAVTGSWAKWSPNITVPGYYKVTLWNPVNSTPDGDPAALLEIKTNGKTLTSTIDWKTGPSRWIDVGTYYFTSTADPLNRDQYVKLTKNTTGVGLNFRVDAASFTEANVAANDTSIQKLAFDGVTLTNSMIDGYKHILSNMKDTLDVSAVANNKDAMVKINDVAITDYNYSLPLNKGVNTVNVTVTVGEATSKYLLTIVNPVIINETDSEVVVTGPWTLSTTVKGFNDSSSLYCGDSPEAKTIKYPVNANGQRTVYGKTEVWVYKLVYDADLSSGKADPAVTYNIKTGSKIEPATISSAEGTSGWVKLGTYNFTGATDGSEYVELYRAAVNTKTTRADAVRFISAADFSVSYYGLLRDGAPQSYVSGGSFTGNLKLYNISQTSGTVTLILAKYNKYTKQLIETRISQKVTVDKSGFYDIETPAIVLAEGDEELYNFQLFAFDDMMNIKPILEKKAIE